MAQDQKFKPQTTDQKTQYSHSDQENIIFLLVEQLFQILPLKGNPITQKHAQEQKTEWNFSCVSGIWTTWDQMGTEMGRVFPFLKRASYKWVAHNLPELTNRSVASLLKY